MSSLSTVRLATDSQPARNHDVWCVDRRDAKYLFHQIFDLDTYCCDGLRLNDDDVIVDVGANIGVFTLFVAHRLRRMTYFALEPIPAIFSALQKNAAGLDHDVRCLQCGLSDREGESTFDYLPRTPCCSTMYPARKQDEDRVRARRFTEQMIHQTVSPWLSRAIHRMPGMAQRVLAGCVEAYYGSSVKVKCPVTTLSRIIEENRIDRIDLLKIDAERAELDILRGIQSRHWPIIRQMVLEVHYPRGDRYNQLVELLEANGFHIIEDRNPTNDDSRMFFLTRA